MTPVTSIDRSRLHPLAIRLAAAFQASGHELYLVGGGVRDVLRGNSSRELDFATSARPGETAAIVAPMEPAALYRLGEKYGTISAVFDACHVEITTYRAQETYTSGSRKPQVRFGSSVSEDLARRDFTINAMAIELLGGSLIDPHGGQADLAARRLRAVGVPGDRFREDPLRLLRAVRFASDMDLEIEEFTWESMRAERHSIKIISRERVRDEFSKMLTGSRTRHALELLRDSALMTASVPVLVELTRMTDHGPRHPLSLWDHTMRVVEAVSSSLELRWSALLHDIAKPRTRTIETSGRPRFFHHEEVGAALAADALSDLRYPKTVVGGVQKLVETHMQLHSYHSDWTDGAVRRLMLRLDNLTDAAIELATADAAAHSESEESQNAARLAHLSARIKELGQKTTSRLSSPLNGGDLMEQLNRPPGPWIKVVKDALLNEVLEGRLAADDREGAWRLVYKLVN
jgi:poly(A) polymerase